MLLPAARHLDVDARLRATLRVDEVEGGASPVAEGIRRVPWADGAEGELERGALEGMRRRVGPAQVALELHGGVDAAELLPVRHSHLRHVSLALGSKGVREVGVVRGVEADLELVRDGPEVAAAEGPAGRAGSVSRAGSERSAGSHAENRRADQGQAGAEAALELLRVQVKGLRPELRPARVEGAAPEADRREAALPHHIAGEALRASPEPREPRVRHTARRAS